MCEVPNIDDYENEEEFIDDYSYCIDKIYDEMKDLIIEIQGLHDE